MVKTASVLMSRALTGSVGSNPTRSAKLYREGGSGLLASLIRTKLLVRSQLSGTNIGYKMRYDVIVVSVCAMLAIAIATANWRQVEIAKINAEVQKVQAEQGKKFKFGTTKDE